MFCLKISYIIYHIETNQIICKANQLTGSYMKCVCTERYFRASNIRACTYRALKTLIRYTKKRAPKINSDVCFTKIL